MATRPDFWWQWPFWRNTLVIVTALFIGWGFDGFLGKSTGDPIQAENRQLHQYTRQLELQVNTLQAQMIDYQALEQAQQEVINELRAGNQALQDKLFSLEKDLQQYREAIASRTQ